MDQASTLQQLHRRIQDSRRRLEAVTAVLPGNLIAQIEAGPLDEASWTLLVTNAAVAAKLRQWLPRIEAALRDTGWPDVSVRIHITR